MAGETVITVVGNVTADPELKHIGSGDAVCNFTIASTPRSFDKASNEWKDGEALFLRATAWKNLAEHIAASITKGTRVIAQGRLKQRSYEHEGQKRTSMELEIDAIGPDLQFAVASVQRSTGNRTQADNRAAQQAQTTAADAWSQPAGGGYAGYGDETPF